MTLRSLLFALFAFVCPVLILQGCTGDDLGPLSFEDKPVWIHNEVHDATDALVEQAGSAIHRDTPIVVGTLTDINKVGETSPLGRVLAEHSGSRLVQLGYSVSELKLRDSVMISQNKAMPQKTGEFLLSRDLDVIAKENPASVVVTGTYAVAKRVVFVDLRMIDAETHKVLAAHNFWLPINSDIRELLDPETDEHTLFTSGWWP